MKILKKAISMVLIVALLMSFGIASIASQSDAEVLNDLGLLLNISDAELDAVLTRDVGITMILKSLGYTQSDADDAAFTSPFNDVNDWAVGWASLAYQLDITTGVGENKFDPKGVLTEKQFVAFQLRALNYDTVEAWDNTLTLGRSSGLISSSNTLSDTSYTKRDASEVMYNALSSTDQGSNKTLIERLIEDNVVSESDAEKHDLINADFDVKGIDASNLKIITLDMTQNIDSEFLTGDTVVIEKNGQKLLYDDDVTNGVTAYRYGLEADEEHNMRIIFGTACAQNDKINVQIDGLRSVSAQEMNNYDQDIIVKDTTEPNVVKVESTNPLTVKLYYSEPVQFIGGSKVFDYVKIDDEKIAATATMNYDKTIVVFELADELDEGSHDFEVEETKDYASLEDDGFEGTFTVEDDTTAPYVIEAYAPNRSELIVVFNEDIVETAGEIIVGNDEYKLSDDSLVTVDDDTVTIELIHALSASDAVSGNTAEYDDIEDIMGNRVKSKTSFSFKAEYDSTSPTLEAKVTSSNEIIVTFSEEVQSFTSINFVVFKYDDDDNEVVISISSVNASGSSKSIYKILLQDPIIDEIEYTLSVKGVKDVSVFQNSVEDTEIVLLMNDLNQPSVTGVKLIGNETVRVSFSEPMKRTDLLDPDNYKIDDDSENVYQLLSEFDDYEITVDDDLEYVDIYLKDLEDEDRIAVMKMYDLSGMVLDDYNDRMAIVAPDEFNAADIEAQLVELDKIKLIATGHEFGRIYADDFIIRTAGGDSNTHYVYRAEIDSEDASIAYLTLNADLGTDARVSGQKQYLYMDDEIITMDIYDQPLEIKHSGPEPIEDFVKPTIEVDLDTADEITIEFSEVISTGGVSDIYDDVLLKDKDGDYVDLSTDVTLSYSGGNGTANLFKDLTISGLNGGEDYTLEIVARHLEDEQGNITEKYEKTTFEVEE